MKEPKDQTDDLRALFEQDAPALPESLQKDAIVEKLKDHQPQAKPKIKRLLPRVAAVAAALAVIAASVAIAPKHLPHKAGSAPQTQTMQQPQTAQLRAHPELLPQFESDEDLKQHFEKMQSMQEARDDYKFSPTMVANAVTNASPEAAVDLNGGMISKDASAVADSYSKTNVQVSGVDEADIVKNDGRYLYLVRGTVVSIVDTQSMKEVWYGEVKPEDKDNSYRFSELYLNGERMVLLGYEYQKPKLLEDTTTGETSDMIVPRSCFGWRQTLHAVLLAFDVSDRAAPKLLRTVTQDGDLTNTRMVGSVLYTVTNYWAAANDDPKKGETYAPKVNGRMISYKDVYIRDPKEQSQNYLVLTAWDTAAPESEPTCISMLGGGEHLYCSTDTLLMTRWSITWNKDCTKSDVRTYLYAFSFSGTELALSAKGWVPGTVEDQYSMDQSGDTFRITTNNHIYQNDKDVCSLYVLDRDLKTVGALKDFAGDERIESTRFFGNTAYVVTFRQTDPLFVIDLTDPAKPAVKGELKLPGFSSYLHPVTDTLVVGFGYDGDEDNADYDTVKLSLFDVSDPAKPKELDRKVFSSASSEATMNPKSLIYDAETKTFGFPLEYWLWDEAGDEYLGMRFVYETLRIENGTFTDEKSFLHHALKESDAVSYPAFLRGAIIGEHLYVMTDSVVKEFDRDDARELRALNLKAVKAEPMWPIAFNEPYVIYD